MTVFRPTRPGLIDFYRLSDADQAAQMFKLMRAPARSLASFSKGVQWGTEGTLLGVPLIAFSVATGERGEKLSLAAGAAASTAMFPVFSGVAAAGLSLIPGLGQGLALTAATVLAMYPSVLVENGVGRAVREFSQFGRRMRRLEQGGDYEDSESAAMRRLRAVQDMSASMQASRTYLGREALLYR